MIFVFGGDLGPTWRQIVARRSQNEAQHQPNIDAQIDAQIDTEQMSSLFENDQEMATKLPKPLLLRTGGYPLINLNM